MVAAVLAVLGELSVGCGPIAPVGRPPAASVNINEQPVLLEDEPDAGVPLQGDAGPPAEPIPKTQKETPLSFEELASTRSNPTPLCECDLLEPFECESSELCEYDPILGEKTYLKEHFQQLKELEFPPDFVGPALIKRVLVACFGKKKINTINVEKDVRPSGAYLDEQKMVYLLALSYDQDKRVLIVLDSKGRLTHKLNLVKNRTSIYLKDVVGDQTLEVIVNRIESKSYEYHPATWLIYRLDKKGRLKEIARHAKSDGYNAKRTSWIGPQINSRPKKKSKVRYCFINRFLFPKKGIMNIFTAKGGRACSFHEIPGPQKSPIGMKELREHIYDEKRKRFVETTESKTRIREKKKAIKKARKEWEQRAEQKIRFGERFIDP